MSDDLRMAGELHPLVSIIVPVYNTGAYLYRCLDSISEQTLEDWECILVDDGSTDGGGAVCDTYASHDGRFHVIHQENKGETAARNAGLREARGKWIGFVDSDDWIDSETYETAAKIAEENGSDLVQWGMCSFSDRRCSRKTIKLEPGKFVFKDSPKYFEPSMCPKLVRASLMRDNNIDFPVGVTLSGDRYCSMKTYIASGGCYFINKPFYHYYMRTGSASHSMTRAMILKETELVLKMEKMCEPAIQDSNEDKLKDFIFHQKVDVKRHILLGMKEPDFVFCVSTFPEIDKTLAGERSRFGILYFLVHHRLYCIARAIIAIWCLISI